TEFRRPAAERIRKLYLRTGMHRPRLSRRRIAARFVRSAEKRSRRQIRHWRRIRRAQQSPFAERARGGSWHGRGGGLRGEGKSLRSAGVSGCPTQIVLYRGNKIRSQTSQ